MKKIKTFNIVILKRPKVPTFKNLLFRILLFPPNKNIRIRNSPNNNERKIGLEERKERKTFHTKIIPLHC